MSATHPAAPSAAPGWPAEIGYRMRKLLVLKLVGTTAFTWIFFVGYFYLLRNPTQPPTVMPLTALDHWIPFQPATLFAYLSLWFYVGIAPGLQRSFAQLLVYGLWVSSLCLAGLAIFYVWPTAVPPSGIDMSGHAGFALLQGVDAAGNAFPSMHVAIAIFTAVHIELICRAVGVPAGWRLLNLLWLLAICWSTLAVRQHVVLDVVGGAALGLAFALPSLRWQPGPARLSSNAGQGKAPPATAKALKKEKTAP